MDKKELMDICEELISNPPCCRELQEAGRKWLDAVGTADEHAAAEALIKELEEDVNTIDDTIGFFSSPMAEKYFGAEGAKQKLEEIKKAKENGEVWCTCPACQKGAALLAAKDILLA